jgi:regulator of cell morphogenesis and NO signaling
MADPGDAAGAAADDRDWSQAALTELMQHIHGRFHQPLREELPRLSAMMTTVVEHDGNRLPHVLPPLQWTFDVLRSELLDHLHQEDDVLFPAVARMAADVEAGIDAAADWSSIIALIDRIESDTDATGATFAEMRELTHNYALPGDASPSLRALYHRLTELERTTLAHAHLENQILFPRVVRSAEL